MIKAYLWKFITFLAAGLPKNKKKWVFGAWVGKLYADNSKALFQYINEKHSEITPIWITQEKFVIDHVRSMGYRCYHKNSPIGIWHWMTAGACFITEGVCDIGPAIGTGDQKIIQLWHGMGIKAVGINRNVVKNADENKLDALKKKYENKHGKWYWMCASEECRNKYSGSYFIPEEQMFITGQPKDDAFSKNLKNAYIDEIRAQFPGARICVYLPTHRNFGREQEVPQQMNIETLTKVDRELAANNLVLIFKPHMHEFAVYAGYETSFRNIIFATDKEKYGDVYEFLPACDLMITDYSGIMFGYLASGKPIIYFPYDLETYKNSDMGFYYNYEEILYGPVCRNWDEVIHNMAHISAEDYARQRKELRERFCPYDDGENCRRVYEQTCKLVGLKEK